MQYENYKKVNGKWVVNEVIKSKKTTNASIYNRSLLGNKDKDKYEYDRSSSNEDKFIVIGNYGQGEGFFMTILHFFKESGVVKMTDFLEDNTYVLNKTIDEIKKYNSDNNMWDELCETIYIESPEWSYGEGDVDSFYDWLGI